MAEYRLQMSLGFGSREKAGLVLKAIAPELGAAHERRSTTSVKIKNDALLIDIKAQDRTALRAATNGILNSVVLSKNVMEV